MKIHNNSDCMCRRRCFNAVTALILGYAISVGGVLAGETVNKQMPSGQSESQSNPLESNLQHVDEYLSQLEPALRLFEEQLPALIQKWRTYEDPTSREALNHLVEEHTALEKKCEELKTQLAELKQALELKNEESRTASIEQLEGRLKTAEKEKAELEKKHNELARRIADSQVRSDAPGGHLPSQTQFSKDTTPVFIMVTGGRVVPIAQPYYNFRYGYIKENEKLVRAVEIKRVQDGETVTEALKTGGCLEKLLSDFDLQKQYLNFQVCKDSIAAFHLVIEEIRKRKIPYTWGPQKDRTFVSRLSGNDDQGSKRSGPWGEKFNNSAR